MNVVYFKERKKRSSINSIELVLRLEKIDKCFEKESKEIKE